MIGYSVYMRHEFIDMFINNIRLIHILACNLGTKKKNCDLIVKFQNSKLIKKCGDVSQKVFTKAPFNSHIWVTMLDFICVCLTYS